MRFVAVGRVAFPGSVAAEQGGQKIGTGFGSRGSCALGFGELSSDALEFGSFRGQFRFERTESPLEREVRSVLVLANWENSQARKLFAELNAWLLERVDDVRSEGDVRAFCDTQEARLSRGLEIDTPDLVIVLGGDGAMLAAVRAFRDHPAPTLGINFGRVGFLAACPAGPWQEVVAGVLEGGGVLEPRMRLAATPPKDL